MTNNVGFFNLKLERGLFRFFRGYLTKHEIRSSHMINARVMARQGGDPWALKAPLGLSESLDQGFLKAPPEPIWALNGPPWALKGLWAFMGPWALRAPPGPLWALGP